MDFYKIFYWLTVADKFSNLFLVAVWVTTILTLAALLGVFVQTGIESDEFTPRRIKNEDGIWVQTETHEDAKNNSIKFWYKQLYRMLWICFVTWCLYVSIPSRKDALLIIAGGGIVNFMTQDSSMKQIPKELSNFVLINLKNMGASEGVELLQTQTKQMVLDEAKNMTPEQLLNRIQSDSTFRKLVIE